MLNYSRFPVCTGLTIRVLFFPSFTALKTYDFWKKDVNTPLVSVIWRDGVLYFFAIFSMNFTNVMIFLTAPHSLRAINLT